ncbi:hypothetical protein B0919_15305 [Hymenobacter sp. CRA2]|nr:hypothetical protein B0919_15305 [Hymenobacter sp. CRA2]
MLTSTLLGLLTTYAAQGQRKLSNGLELRTEAQLEYVRPDGDFWWGSLHADHRLQDYAESFALNWGQVGYEHFWSQHWSGGANARLYVVEELNGGDISRLRAYFRPELLLRHRSQVLGLTFGQRLSAEYLFQEERNLGTARLRLDLERVIPVGERLKLRPRVAYEAAANIRLQPPDDAPEERTLEQGIWRAEVGVRLSDHFDLTPYVARQSDYRFFLFQFDADGNVTSGGRTNVRTPVIGVDLRFTLFKNQLPAEWLPLPTQH